MLKVRFFQDGNTMAFRDGQQVPDLQESWILLYVQYLVTAGVDPTKVKFTMPGGSRVTVFEIEGGYNWQFGGAP